MRVGVGQRGAKMVGGRIYKQDSHLEKGRGGGAGLTTVRGRSRVKSVREWGKILRPAGKTGKR